MVPKLIDLAYRHPPDPDLSQSILYFLHLRRVNNGFNLFHLFYLPEDSFLIPSSPARPGGCETATAILKGEEGIHAACPLISVAAVEERVISVVVANFRSEQPLREDLVG